MWPQRASSGNTRSGSGPRTVVEDAQAVLMASVGCSAEAALALLVAHSQRSHRTLRDLAEEVVAGTGVPGGRPDGGTG